MDVEALAVQEIDAALARWRLDTERRIARGRVVIFSVVTVTTVVVTLLLLPGQIPYTSAWFGWWTLVALVLRRHVAWFAAAPRRSLVATAADVCALAFTSPVLALGERLSARDPSVVLPADGPGVFFGLLLTGLALVAICGIHASRTSERITWAQYGMATVAYVVATALHFTLVRSDFVAREIASHGVPRLATPAVVMAVITFLLAASQAARAARENRMRLLELAKLTLLKRLVPAAAVDRMDSGPNVSLAGQLVEVTLVATDLRGFTAMSEKLTPAEVVDELNAYHEAMLEVIDAHGGELDKFIGDGALIVFNRNGAGQDRGAAAAVDCARAMLQRLQQLNAARRAEGKGPLAMGIGVHTGFVISGAIGAGSRLEMTVIGDAVNTASRLESLTKEAGVPVLVSEATKGLLADTSTLRDLGARPVRGKAEALRIYGLEP